LFIQRELKPKFTKSTAAEVYKQPPLNGWNF